jgi:hypothetical protein
VRTGRVLRSHSAGRYERGHRTCPKLFSSAPRFRGYKTISTAPSLSFLPNDLCQRSRPPSGVCSVDALAVRPPQGAIFIMMSISGRQV